MLCSVTLTQVGYEGSREQRIVKVRVGRYAVGTGTRPVWLGSRVWLCARGETVTETLLAPEFASSSSQGECTPETTVAPLTVTR